MSVRGDGGCCPFLSSRRTTQPGLSAQGTERATKPGFQIGSIDLCRCFLLGIPGGNSGVEGEVGVLVGVARSNSGLSTPRQMVNHASFHDRSWRPDSHVSLHFCPPNMLNFILKHNRAQPPSHKLKPAHHRKVSAPTLGVSPTPDDTRYTEIQTRNKLPTRQVQQRLSNVVSTSDALFRRHKETTPERHHLTSSPTTPPEYPPPPSPPPYTSTQP